MTARKMRAAAAMAAAVAVALCMPAAAWAHAGLVQSEDVPLPTQAALGAAGAVLVVSFFALSVAWKKPLFEDGRCRPLPTVVSSLLLNRFVAAIAGAIGVFLLGLTIYAGLRGTIAPDRNFAVGFTFVTFYLGLVLLSVLFGDVFRAFNPWRAIARVVAGGFKLIAGQSAPAPLTLPERVGRWPAVGGIVAFVWLELVWGQGLQSLSVTPYDTALAALIYSVYTFVMMALFGIERWLERGEAFSVYFSMFARLSTFAVRGGRVVIQRPLSGLRDWAGEIAGSVALVLVSIGLTLFDGSTEGLYQEPIALLRDGWFAGLGPAWSARLALTIFMAASLAFVLGIYWLGIAGMRTVKPDLTTRELGQRFCHSFVPIALAYLVAHYFSYFVLLEQAQFGFLLSDPLGTGIDLFGTADNGIDYAVLSATLVWWVQLISLVTGHVIALALGHDRALAVFGDQRTAVRSQYWMLALMVGFTYTGIWLLSLANA
ncbi:fenitrothion hydrolase [Thermoleophilia bacterium SCSIO 60948]|nr:fenitrothion hydrolase [Thermoleophilia bacterium SCSIO 60948]